MLVPPRQDGFSEEKLEEHERKPKLQWKRADRNYIYGPASGDGISVYHFHARIRDALGKYSGVLVRETVL